MCDMGKYYQGESKSIFIVSCKHQIQCHYKLKVLPSFTMHIFHSFAHVSSECNWQSRSQIIQNTSNAFDDMGTSINRTFCHLKHYICFNLFASNLNIWNMCSERQRQKNARLPNEKKDHLNLCAEIMKKERNWFMLARIVNMGTLFQSVRMQCGRVKLFRELVCVQIWWQFAYKEYWSLRICRHSSRWFSARALAANWCSTTIQDTRDEVIL